MSFVSGIGSSNVDLLFYGLPHLPAMGSEIFSKGFSMQLGGGVPATLITLSRLGVPSKILTWLGKDQFSEFARKEFLRCGAEPYNLYRGTGMPVNLTTSMITPTDRTFVSYTDGHESFDDYLEETYRQMHGAKVLDISPEGPLEVYQKLKEEGTILVLDMGWNEEMSLEKYGPWLKLADYYTPNLPESLKITGEKTAEAAIQVLNRYFPQVIVKLDQGGCLIRSEGREHIIPALKVPFVDSTGAGDAFLAGFIYGIYHGASFPESVLYGNITGGKCVTAVGCLAAYNTESELLTTAKENAHLLPDWA